MLRDRLRQLNVQRDIFVRDLGFVWLLFVTPDTALALRNHAPDFSDFTALWLEAASGVAPALRASPLPAPGTWWDRNVSAATWLIRRYVEELAPALRSSLDLLDRGRLDEARDALESARASAGAPPAGLSAVRAAWFLAAGEPDRAESALTEALTGGASGAGSPCVLRILRGMARAARLDLSGARADLEAGCPEAPALQAALAPVARGRLAHLNWQMGRLAEARAGLEVALAEWTRLHGTEEHPDVASTLYAIAGVLQDQGDLAQARAYLKRGIRVQESFWGTDSHPDVARALASLGRVLILQGKKRRAREHLDRSLAIQEALYGNEAHPDVVATQRALAELLLVQGDVAGARARLERSLEMEQAWFGSGEHPAMAEGLAWLAVSYYLQGDLPVARLHLERSLGILDSRHGTDPQPVSALIQALLGAVLYRQGDLSGAAERLECSLHALVALRGSDEHPEVPAVLTGLGAVRLAQGELSAAERCLQRSLEVARLVHPRGGHPTLVGTVVLLAEVRRVEGDLAYRRVRHD